MANADLHVTPTSGRSFLAHLAAPFRAVGAGLVRLSENTSTARALTRLQEMSDDELARHGTTRIAEVRRILGSYGAV